MSTDKIFVIHSFYMDMRTNYVNQEASIYYYLVSWDQY